MSAIATISQENKAARGTKRVCQACGVRFYDLTRDPIVCPACATEYAVVSAVAGPQVGVIAPSNKTSWRSRTAKPARPALPERAPDAVVPDAPQEEDAPAEEPITEGEEELVLEPDAEDGDYSDDIDTAVIEPEER